MSVQILSFEAIGTKWEIELFYEGNIAVLKQEILDLIEEFDKCYSRFRVDSLITKMAHAAGTYILPGSAAPLLNLYQELYVITEGAVTPLIGSVMEQAGYDAYYSLQATKLESPPPLEQILAYNPPSLTINTPALLDFGAAGKGYLVDLVAGILDSNQTTSFCINAGGDIFYRNITNEPLKIGLEHPTNEDEAIGSIQICNQSICGSAGNRRAWGEFHHIINPKTLSSPRHILATWVIADMALLADGLATALFFVPAETLLSKYEMGYILVYEDFTVEHSPSLPIELFLT